MSEHEDNGTGGLQKQRAYAVADRIADEYSVALDSLEGVRLALALAYSEGVQDGTDQVCAVLRGELAKL